MRSIRLVLATGLISFAQNLTPSLAEELQTLERELRTALVNRIDVGKQAVGVVVGIVTPQGRRIVAHGHARRKGDTPVDADTIFEIGSVTKVFTSLLLADMVQRGEVKLTDPVSAFLPKSVAVPSRNSKRISLTDLATHTSGLPRDASNLAISETNPYAAYGPEELYAFLANYSLQRDPGERFEYSNVGASLLAHVLAIRGGKSYEELLQERIFTPLKLQRTTLDLSSAQLARLATGYDGALEPVGLWEVDKLPGAGSIRSSANDMLTFAAAWLGLVEHPLKGAMAQALEITRPGITPQMKQHLGWAETPAGVLIHSGKRGGFSSALAVHPGRKMAVVVLSNSVHSVDDLALHTLAPSYPLKTFSPPRQEIAIRETVLQTYVGTYGFAPGISLQVSREGAQLYGQVTGQPRFKMYAENEAEFFVKEVDVRIRFNAGEDGAIRSITLRQNGRDQTANRLR